ncbi:hypothetical protein jhhlp_000545 [Lomentospora prolificans]|uniref:Uncharacterized protein n=1 Tax=Lomentospora prolificans TaxID=41688 RepID=A0A2N3NL80_9PEZI|nr:hypothetical protein jhhlp_000545 [Lomentospora prolificans]
MALPPIVTATIQSTVLAAVANFLAQFFRSYRLDEFLEHTYPAREPVSKLNTKGEKKQGPAKPTGETPLNVRNTVIKTVLDQTVGSAVNTILFAVFMNGLAAAMTPLQSETELLNLRLAGRSLDYLRSGGAIDYSRVNLAAVLSQSAADFWPIMTSGWSFWPFVSLVNFALVKSVQARNLVGGLAGMAWGMYMSGFVDR